MSVIAVRAVRDRRGSPGLRRVRLPLGPSRQALAIETRHPKLKPTVYRPSGGPPNP